ncbi:MAG: histidinol-phosphatase [Clostridia bacterium]|nr:histidinol-phosphatase [Clostridia bacterium]
MINACQNLHTHTKYCDGANTPEEMITSAVQKKMTSIGFSGHALTKHDTSYCMSREGTLRYCEEIKALKEKYRHVIDVYIGLEQDYYSVEPFIDTDYIIGSVHYVKKSGEFIPVDETKEIVLEAVNRLYDGDIYSYLEDYYCTVSDVQNKTQCHIIGHFDLPERFNADGRLFDRENERYINAWQKAARTLVKSGAVFEINTGGMSKGYTKEPYPSADILRYIAKLGGKVTVSSDSHNVSSIDYRLNESVQLAKDCGFTEIYFFDGSMFIPKIISH